MSAPWGFFRELVQHAAHIGQAIEHCAQFVSTLRKCGHLVVEISITLENINHYAMHTESVWKVRWRETGDQPK